SRICWRIRRHGRCFRQSARKLERMRIDATIDAEAPRPCQAGAASRVLDGRLTAIALLVLGAAALGSGCAFKAPPGRAAASMSALGVENRPYRIRVGDSLDVRFYKTPELNIEKIPVRSDGKISLDLVGDVQAAGLGTDELSANLVHAYSRELQEPQIAVI